MLPSQLPWRRRRGECSPDPSQARPACCLPARTMPVFQTGCRGARRNHPHEAGPQARTHLSDTLHWLTVEKAFRGPAHEMWAINSPPGNTQTAWVFGCCRSPHPSGGRLGPQSARSHPASVYRRLGGGKSLLAGQGYAQRSSSVRRPPSLPFLECLLSLQRTCVRSSRRPPLPCQAGHDRGRPPQNPPSPLLPRSRR